MEELKSNPDWKQDSKIELYEFENSVRISMGLLSDYIDKGLEIYQALDVPENERYEFPDYKQLLQIKEAQKPLELPEVKDEKEKHE